MDKNKMEAAEHMADNLLKDTKTHPKSKTIAFDGKEICHASQIKTSNNFEGYTDFLMT
jgi:uncharacterized protein with PhoU and TrkA domain